MFITFEGGEGAGKTTVLERLAQRLTKEGFHVIKTREPGGIPISEKIRAIILNPEHTNMDARTEALLYAAARRQHLVEKIEPAIKEGKVVLCDRFVDSSLAYQGAARGLGMEEILQINQFAIQDRMPDMTLFFDLSPEAGLKRIAENKSREQNRLDLESMPFHLKVYEAYQQLLEKFPERIHRIQAKPGIVEVEEEAYNLVKSKLSEIG